MRIPKIFFFTSLFLCLSLNAVAKPKKVYPLPLQHLSFTQEEIKIPMTRFPIEKVELTRTTCTVTVHENLSNIPMTQAMVQAIYDSLHAQIPATYWKYDMRIVSRHHLIEDYIPNQDRPKGDIDKDRYPNYEPQTTPCERLSNPWKPSLGLANRNIALWSSHGRYYDPVSQRVEWQRPALFGIVEDLITSSVVNTFLMPMLRNAGAEVYMPRERDLHKEEWVLEPQEEGDSLVFTGQVDAPDTYWVRVQYPFQKNASKDVRVKVYHGGVVTEYSLNQQMGGGHWFYLDPLHFTKDIRVVAYNQDPKRKWGLEMVKVGGGCSSLNGEWPAYPDAACYYLRKAGLPDSLVYNQKPEKNSDYFDDIYSRSKWTNYLCGGTDRFEEYGGIKIPLDASLAIHSDAGSVPGDSLIGTLVLCTSDSIAPSGYSQLAGNDFAEYVRRQIVQDLRFRHTPDWPSRGIWHRQYVETRIPAVPALIVELFSHQNFADMKRALKPGFKFTAARAIYKGTLKYLAEAYGVDYVVQPLPVSAFSATLVPDSVQLNWKAVADPLEPTAYPTHYKVYTRLNEGSFDNGVVVRGTSVRLPIQADSLYSYKIVALNEGGESFPSEVLSVCQVSNAKGEFLIVNGFDRLDGPEMFSNEEEGGFRFHRDFGVPYMCDISYVGNQYEYDRSQPFVSNYYAGFGASYNDTTRVIAGNTLNYPYVHGKALRAAGYSFSSCSKYCVMRDSVSLFDYDGVDLILGKQRGGHNCVLYPVGLQTKLFAYLQSYKAKLIVTGAYLASSLPTEDVFASKAMRYQLASTWATKTGEFISNKTGQSYHLLMEPDSKQYFVQSVDAVRAIHGDNAEVLFHYADRPLDAAIGVTRRGKSVFAGFPLEAVVGEEAQQQIMQLFLDYLY